MMLAPLASPTLAISPLTLFLLVMSSVFAVRRSHLLLSLPQLVQYLSLDSSTAANFNLVAGGGGGSHVDSRILNVPCSP